MGTEEQALPAMSRDESDSDGPFFSVAYAKILQTVELWPEPGPLPVFRRQFVEPLE